MLCISFLQGLSNPHDVCVDSINHAVYVGELDPTRVWKMQLEGARKLSKLYFFKTGAMGRRIDPSWGGPIELFLVPASAPRLV